jgi:hypothetical protein
MADRVTVKDEAVVELVSGREMRRLLNAFGFQLTGTAVPYSGVDTGRLVNSMGHRVELRGDRLVTVCGSGAADHAEAVWHGWYHWGAVPPPPGEGANIYGDQIREPRRDHPTKPGPTRPWSSALRELGWSYTVTGQGAEL